ncbi:MAG: hypothetical protein K8H86_15485 [Ignavibacteriaceae bacterium]|nr:hypothetical protein [Ignavibacteriaceae bacterium]
MTEEKIRTSPLQEYYEKLGASFWQEEDIIKIKSFGDLDVELHSLYEGVALRDISAGGVIELKGNDALDLLNRISTNSVKNLIKEDVKDTIFVTEKGRIIDVAKLVNFGSHLIMLTSSEHQLKVLRWIQKYIITDDVVASDVTGKFAILELIGPQADSFISLVCGKVVNEIHYDKFRIIDAEGTIFFLMKLKDVNDNSKFIIISEPGSGKRLLEFMINNSGPFDFSLIGEDAYEAYRIERGIPKAPNELNDEFNPHEAKLLGIVDFNKGCYIGQEVIARLDTYQKAQKFLTGLKFEENPERSLVYKLTDAEGNDAGLVTSIGYSPKCKKAIGLGYVRKEFIEEGTLLSAVSVNGKINVTVYSTPFKK